jgi:hypothetical protein
MSTFTPAYRMTLYAPRSVDATETTVLTPVAGAAHSDPFVVASMAGVTGALPYLGIPSGWTGSLDPLKGRATTGTITVQLQDQRVASGGSNAARWVTAFLGDGAGVSRLKGRKAYLEQSTDGGSTWAAYWTGRISDVALNGRLGVTCTIKDAADDLTRHAFVGWPHADVASYAFTSSLLPLGVPQAYGRFAATANVATGAMMRVTGTVYRLGSHTRDGATIWKGLIVLDDVPDRRALLVTQSLWTALQARTPLRVVAAVSGGGNGHFVWADFGGGVLYGHAAGGQVLVNLPGNRHFSIGRIGWIETLPPGDPQYVAMPADGTAVTIYVTTANVEPTADAPLFINDVHPVQLWADLVDGKFGALQADGAAVPLAGRDTSIGGAWDVLRNDPSFGTMRFMIDHAWSASDFIEQCICQPLELGYRLDAAGRVVPIDLRRSSTTAATATLVDDDVVEGAAPAWQDSAAGAVTATTIQYYVDRKIPVSQIDDDSAVFPDVAPALIAADKEIVLVPNDLTVLGDVKENILKLDAAGFRIQEGEQEAGGGSRADALVRRLGAMAQDLMAPYTRGAMRTTIAFRRATAADTVYAGTWCSVTVAALPDPATNQRGGTRLMLCTGRREEALAITLDFVDAGPSGVALPPSLAAPTASGTDNGALDVTVTLNAAGDPAQLQYALTATAVGVRPAADAAIWTPVPRISANGAQHIGRLPAGLRVWLRARSFPLGVQRELPSSWAYPSGTGYLDLVPPGSASAVATSAVYANRMDVQWSLADATLPVEVFLTDGGVPAAWTLAMQRLSLAPGTTTCRLGDLTASTTYTIGVRTRTPNGGAGAMATKTQATGATTGTAPAPTALDLCVAGGA